MGKLNNPDKYRQYMHGKKNCGCVLSQSNPRQEDAAIQTAAILKRVLSQNDSRQEDAAIQTAAILKAYEGKLSTEFDERINDMIERRNEMSDNEFHYAHLNLESISDDISTVRDTIESVKPCVSLAAKSPGSVKHFETYGISVRFEPKNVKLSFNTNEEFTDFKQIVDDYNRTFADKLGTR